MRRRVHRASQGRRAIAHRRVDLKANRETCKLPIVAVTAYPDEYQRAELMAAGCAAYLVKPIDNRQLLQELERARSTRIDCEHCSVLCWTTQHGLIQRKHPHGADDDASSMYTSSHCHRLLQAARGMLRNLAACDKLGRVVSFE